MSTKKERPLLFSGPMVRAILNGTKTQTRRIVKPNHIAAYHDGVPSLFSGFPYGVNGDRLWVRETWSHTGDGVWSIAAARMAPTGRPVYAADGGEGPWWPSIHMPREFSRITLEVVRVRVERLNDCSEADAKAEGCGLAPALPDCTEVEACGQTFRAGYAALWNDINGPGSWEANPWVWVITFKRIEA